MLTHSHRDIHGFTLVEIAVVLVVLSMLYFIGVPTFSEWTQNSQIRVSAESILSGLQTARTEAIRRNARIEFRLSDNVTAAGGTGWRVVQVPGPDIPADCKIDGLGSDDRTRVVMCAPDNEVRANVVVTPLPDGATTITFDGSGRVPLRSAGGATNADGTPFLQRLDIVNAAAPDNFRQLRILIDDTGGRVLMCDPKVTANNDPRRCPL